MKDEKTPVPVVASVDYSALFASMGSSGSLTKASGVNYYGGRRIIKTVLLYRGSSRNVWSQYLPHPVLGKRI